MSKRSKSKSGEFKKQLRTDILDLFRSSPKTVRNYKQVSASLGIKDPELRKLIFSVLNELSASGELKEKERGKFRLGTIKKLEEGVLEMNRKGFGFVRTGEKDEDIFIKRNFLDDAIHGDKVVVELLRGSRGKSKEGRIVQVIDRDKRRFVGTLKVNAKNAFLIPDDQRIDVDIYIPKERLKGGLDGEKAIVKIDDWPKTAKSPFGTVTEVLGYPDSNDAEMKSILIANGIRYEFPQEVMDEADRIPMSLDEEEISKRRDYRDILTITIDPVDARDFDDALSLERLENGRYRVGIHIADVSHYVKEGSHLDKESRERGNSVYLVDRVIPMLPEHLSNGVCSLRPNEEKFTFSAIFDLDEKGEVYDEWFGKTVINSDRRFAYEEAQEIIEGAEGDYKDEILILDGIAKNLRKDRMKSGALEVHSSELRFRLDDKGNPLEIIKKTSKDANKLVEEFMLLANKRVATFIGDTKRKTLIPLVYRVHDKPDMEKIQQFKVFVSKFGKIIQFKNDRDIAPKMNLLFEEMKNEPEFATVQQMAIKSMAKAAYDTENIGHFGLAFRYYAHFTSPIRRYADLLVHRILFSTLEKKQKQIKELKDISKHISSTERKAIEAERASNKYFQAKYLEHEVGNVYVGIVTGLTEWGVYVQMRENYCEGMVSFKSMTWDRYYFDEKNYEVIGSRSSDKINLGDLVEVEIVKVNLAKRQIDLEIVP